MTASTTNSFPDNKRGVSDGSFTCKDATSFYGGRWASMLSGRAQPYAGADGEVLLGIITGNAGPNGQPSPVASPTVTYVVRGDDALSPKPAVRIDLGSFILPAQAVSGTLTDDTTDFGKLVYLNADDHTYTITRPATNAQVVGEIFKVTSATVADLFIYDFATRQQVNRDGAGGQELLYLGSVDCDTITAANVRTAIPMPYHGKFLSFFAMVDVAIAGAGGTALLNLEIAGTDVTGGVVTVSTAAGGTKGTKLAGTAITARIGSPAQRAITLKPMVSNSDWKL